MSGKDAVGRCYPFCYNKIKTFFQVILIAQWWFQQRTFFNICGLKNKIFDLQRAREKGMLVRSITFYLNTIGLQMAYANQFN